VVESQVRMLLKQFIINNKFEEINLPGQVLDCAGGGTGDQVLDVGRG
jgi:hypothetical protein